MGGLRRTSCLPTIPRPCPGPGLDGGGLSIPLTPSLTTLVNETLVREIFIRPGQKCRICKR